MKPLSKRSKVYHYKFSIDFVDIKKKINLTYSAFPTVLYNVFGNDNNWLNYLDLSHLSNCHTLNESQYIQYLSNLIRDLPNIGTFIDVFWFCSNIQKCDIREYYNLFFCFYWLKLNYDAFIFCDWVGYGKGFGKLKSKVAENWVTLLSCIHILHRINRMILWQGSIKTTFDPIQTLPGLVLYLPENEQNLINYYLAQIINVAYVDQFMELLQIYDVSSIPLIWRTNEHYKANALSSASMVAPTHGLTKFLKKNTNKCALLKLNYSASLDYSDSKYVNTKKFNYGFSQLTLDKMYYHKHGSFSLYLLMFFQNNACLVERLTNVKCFNGHILGNLQSSLTEQHNEILDMLNMGYNENSFQCAVNTLQDLSFISYDNIMKCNVDISSIGNSLLKVSNMTKMYCKCIIELENNFMEEFGNSKDNNDMIEKAIHSIKEISKQAENIDKLENCDINMYMDRLQDKCDLNNKFSHNVKLGKTISLLTPPAKKQCIVIDKFTLENIRNKMKKATNLPDESQLKNINETNEYYEQLLKKGDYNLARNIKYHGVHYCKDQENMISFENFYRNMMHSVLKTETHSVASQLLGHSPLRIPRHNKNFYTRKEILEIDINDLKPGIIEKISPIEYCQSDNIEIDTDTDTDKEFFIGDLIISHLKQSNIFENSDIYSNCYNRLLNLVNIYKNLDKNEAEEIITSNLLQVIKFARK
ncbi:hypothetical protein A3Q56_01012 [Intoshia linei]|uniref:Uncharacterized protein n=1 Tax=Intoshia linei TaxID=1819745 RepID=A0A177BA87_9BILA|nr:hypothetical protein A3Q56_01012 [Intoshia linei]